MQAINSENFIVALSSDARQILLLAEKLKTLSIQQLTHKPATDRWSIAQCLQHMNVYSRYYLPEIEKALVKAEHTERSTFRSGWLGNYFTNLMKTGANGLVKKKMKSPKNAMPANNPDAQKELEEFILHQHHLLNILSIAKKVELGKVRIPISLSRLIKLKLGDTIAFYVEHEKRHMKQIERVLGV